MTDRTYYTIYWLGGPIDGVKYPTPEAVRPRSTSIPPSTTVAIAYDEDEDDPQRYTIEEWTPENTYQEHWEGETGWVKCDTEEQFAKFTRLAKAWSPENSARITGVTFDELKGKWFQVERSILRFQEYPSWRPA